MSKQNFYIMVPHDENNHDDGGFYEDFEQVKKEEEMSDDFDLLAFSSDPYPSFRKVSRPLTTRGSVMFITVASRVLGTFLIPMFRELP